MQILANLRYVETLYTMGLCIDRVSACAHQVSLNILKIKIYILLLINYEHFLYSRWVSSSLQVFEDPIYSAHNS